MTSSHALPRGAVAGLSAVTGAIFAWAAVLLPWRAWTSFAVLTAIVAAVHLATAVLALVGHPRTGTAWRFQAAVALAYLAYLTFNLLASAIYIARLYGGLGRGVAVSLGLVWVVVVAFTVPLSAWGLAATGGLRWGPRARTLTAAILVLMGIEVLRTRNAAAAETITVSDDALANTLREAIPSDRRAPPLDAPSLRQTAPAECEAPPTPEIYTVVVTALADDAWDRPQPITHCVQATTLADAAARLRGLLADTYAAPIAIDVITGIRPLRHVAPVVDTLGLRPGLDGVCEDRRCLVPWQLLVLDAFHETTPIPVIPDLRFGFDPVALRRALWPDERRHATTPGGLVRIETHGFVADADGELHTLRRLRPPGPALTPEALRAGGRAAEDYIAAAQDPDGRFEYKRNPFTGQSAYRGFSLPRQAGTTLVVCELAEDRERARAIATASLRMLETAGHEHGDLMALHYPPDRPFRFARLGDTALATIAFLSCRDLVGDAFDESIARMTRFLLAMQREDGSFHPEFDLHAGAPKRGPDPLYAVGQAVFALTLLERVAATNDRFPPTDQVHAAVEAAMDYVARDYWNTFAADFFFFEENWHCLAARASLGHHRHAGYERFCLDYVRYKTRLILDETSGVDVDLVGGYGFGNVLIPHTTGSSGFGEASAAALAILAADGQDDPYVRSRLELVLAFLLHQQWSTRSCFACGGERPVPGGFSEHMGSMEIRIDYVQHAMAAMGHGGRVLGWIE